MKHNLQVKPWFLLLIMIFVTRGIISGQKQSITGTVTDAISNELLTGVSITVKGTTEGTITNIDGAFNLNVSTGSTLTISYIGYTTQEVLIEDQTNLSIALEPEVTQIAELIVIGYGTQKKIDKTGAVASVSSEEMNGGVITDPIQAIQGKVAGVVISKKGGDPNSGFKVKIRGAAGFSSNTQPLYVIDGIPNADPTTVAPEDIESYNILKDAASTAIYGSQGSNGVVIITTKKGNQSKENIQFSSNVSFDHVANQLEMLTADQIRNFVAENPSIKFIDGGDQVNWQDQIFRTGISHNNNINFSGGTERSNYYASITNSNWQGVMKGTSKQRTIGKLNLTQKGLDGRLTLSGGISGTFEENDYENYDGYDKDDILYQALQHNPTDPIKDSIGQYYKNSRVFNYENPLSVINGIDNIRDAKRFLGYAKADLEILEGLIVSSNFGYTRDDQESSIFRPKGTIYATADNGFGKKEYKNLQQKLLELTTNYKKSIGSSNIEGILGYSWQETNNNGFYSQAENPQSEFIKYNNLETFVDITSTSISSWAYESRLIGYFGRLQYNYNSQYYLTGSIRRDGSTKFGKNNKWGWFPTVSAGWNIDKEAFMSGIEIINQLKLRTSYGVSGNEKIGEYRSQVVFKSTGTAIDPESGNKVTTFGPAWNANPDLKWERTAELNIGVDFAMFNNRISGSFEIFSKQTTDLLGEYQVPVPPNLAKTTFANSGSMTNRGVELFVQAFVYDVSNFKWKTSMNVTHFRTTIQDLGEYVEGEIKRDGYLSGRGLIGDQNYITGNIEGEELGSFYLPVYKGLSSDGVFLYKSKTGGITREIEQTQREIVGSPAPDLELGWTNNFTFYKHFDLDISIRSMIGNDVYNATRMFFDYPGNLPDLNAVPEALDWYNQGRKQVPTIADIYVEDGSFVRLDFVSLGYNFKLNSLKIKNIRLFVTGNNLFTLTKYKGIDPETDVDGLSFGVDQFNVYPKTRSYSMGISATF